MIDKEASQKQEEIVNHYYSNKIKRERLISRSKNIKSFILIGGLITFFISPVIPKLTSELIIISSAAFIGIDTETLVKRINDRNEK